jgi:probable rRNA maturation factor
MDDFEGGGASSTGAGDELSAAALDVALHVEESVEALVPAGALERIEAAAVAALRHEGLEDASLSIVLTDDGEVQALNRDYRSVDAPTDVLSFAAHEGEEPLHDLPPDLAHLLGREQGDVFIALPYASRQAERFGNPLEDELLLLAVHGVLHLLGYDHATDDEEAALWALQERILQPLGVQGLSLRRHDG